MSWLPPATRRLGRATAVAAVAAALLLSAGCKGGKPGAGTTDGTLKTDFGVTADTIKLGVLTDRTGAFAAAGKSVEQGRTLYWTKKGTVCGRKVELVTKNHGYNAANAATSYSEIKRDVLAIHELLGSPMIGALLKDIETDQMLTGAVSFSSNVLTNKYIVLTGTTYDIEMINAVEYLVKQKGLAKGDKIGHIFQEGDYGENAAAGSRAAAADAGLQLVEQKIKPTDADLTAQVSKLKADGVKAVLLTTSSAQTGSAVSVAEAAKFDVTFIGSSPAFSPALLAGAAKPALEKRFLVAGSVAAFSATATGPTAVRDAFKAKYPSEPKANFVMYGYAQAEIMAQVLEAACKQGDLTRAGLLKAFQSLKAVDTAGLVPPSDYSKQGAIPARQAYIAKADSTAEGGLTVVQELFSAAFAASYQPKTA